MARGLYRAYLYAVTIGSMIFMAVGTGVLLGMVFAESPQVRGPYGFAPAREDIARAAVLAIVSWVVGLGLAGLHYWLIRGDLKADPSAAGSAVRSFFLNGAEALAVMIFVTDGAALLSGLGQSNQGDVSGALALGVVTLALAIAFELERRRTRPAEGAALVFQRLHLYGLPLIFLFFGGAIYWLQALQQTIESVLTSGGQLASGCGPGLYGNCTGPSPVGPWAAALWMSAAWGLYALLARGDTRSILRRVVHLIGFAFGAIITLVAIARGAELGLRALLGIGVSWDDFAHTYSFVPPLVFGALVLVAYGLRLRAEGVRLPMEAPAIRLLAVTIAAGLAAVPFWLGCGGLVDLLVERFAGGTPPSTSEWATTISYVVAGIAYPPLAILLSMDSARSRVAGPRRALVYALLAAGTLASAISAVVILFTLLSEVLGVPVANWQQVARTGMSALVVGLVIVGIHVRILVRERGRSEPPAPVPVQVPQSMAAQ
jgi:hypothetical protein